MKIHITLLLCSFILFALLTSCATTTNNLPQEEERNLVLVTENDVKEIIPVITEQLSEPSALNLEFSTSDIIETPTEEVEEPEEIIKKRSGWFNGIGSIEGLNVKKYRIKGEGPDGAFFDWVELTSNKVALSDIRRGMWHLKAEAIGENGTVVAYGELDTFLSDSTPLGVLLLSDEYGDGDIECTFDWNKDQVIYPSLEIYIKPANDPNANFMARSSNEISISDDGIATWTAHNVKAGSYIVRAILKDEEEIVSGIAAAMRVVNDKISVGDCHIVIGRLSTVFGIDLENIPLNTVVNGLTLNDYIISVETNDPNIICSWFIDGNVIDQYNSYVDLSLMNLKKGFYRIDCIIQNPESMATINTLSSFVFYTDEGLSFTDESESDSKPGDAPEGYEEVITQQN